MNSTESNQRHHDHIMNRLMMAVVEDSEVKAMVEALAVAMDRLFVTTVEP